MREDIVHAIQIHLNASSIRMTWPCLADFPILGESLLPWRRPPLHCSVTHQLTLAPLPRYCTLHRCCTAGTARFPAQCTSLTATLSSSSTPLRNNRVGCNSNQLIPAKFCCCQSAADFHKLGCQQPRISRMQRVSHLWWTLVGGKSIAKCWRVLHRLWHKKSRCAAVTWLSPAAPLPPPKAWRGRVLPSNHLSTVVFLWSVVGCKISTKKNGMHCTKEN